jgi:hypothetical protein
LKYPLRRNFKDSFKQICDVTAMKMCRVVWGHTEVVKQLENRVKETEDKKVQELEAAACACMYPLILLLYYREESGL